MTPIVCTLALLTGALSMNIAFAQTGPHGGEVVEQNGRRYEVVVNQDAQQMRVYVENVTEPVPQTLQVRIKRGNTLLDQVDVKLMNLNEGRARFGALYPFTQGSYAGVEFEIAAF